MKNCKKLVVAIAMVVIAISCQKNDNYELEQSLMSNNSKNIDSNDERSMNILISQNPLSSDGFEYVDPDNPPPNPFTQSKILIEYAPGTSEAEKISVRNTLGLDIGFYSYTVCSLNPDAETWVVWYLTEQQFINDHKDNLEGDEDIDKATYEARCN